MTIQDVGGGVADWAPDRHRQIVVAAIGAEFVIVDCVIGTKSGVFRRAIDIDKLGVRAVATGYFNMLGRQCFTAGENQWHCF